MQNIVLRPDFKKMFTVNCLKVTLGLAGLIMALILFNSIVGLDIFAETITEIAKTFGKDSLNVNTAGIITWIIIIFILGYVALLTLNFFLLSNIRYELLPESIACYTTAFFILLNTTEIPYKNISRISFESDGIVNSMLDTGNVVLDLSAMKQKTFKLECVDNPQQIAQYIQQRIRDYNTRYYASNIRVNRVDNILSRGGL